MCEKTQEEMAGEKGLAPIVFRVRTEYVSITLLTDKLVFMEGLEPTFSFPIMRLSIRTRCQYMNIKKPETGCTVPGCAINKVYYLLTDILKPGAGTNASPLLTPSRAAVSNLTAASLCAIAAFAVSA